ncbi:MAG: amidohydrolase family protein [Chloroflexi bacterium]|nr:amidohydrolase family protein [Chloroflexota bacterium]
MSTLKLPGLVDIHVHMREPGATHKEDYDSGTAAALVGGFTVVCAMPNTTPPLTDGETLARTEAAARAKARCDYGLYFGAGADNAATAKTFTGRVSGMKMYLDQTFGPLRLDELGALVEHAANWPAASPLLCHAEGRTVGAAILAANLAGRSVHICHVSRKDEIELIRKAKDKGFQVTCEVTPHHMFLTDADIPTIGSGRGEVRPRLATDADRDALIANLDIVDCFATDHAPHTLAEKDSDNPPPGFPGLETALALCLRLVHDGRLTLDGLIQRMAVNPRSLLNLKEQTDTWVEIDPDAEWVAQGATMQTRAKWTPFEGWTMRGRVERVVLRGQDAYRNGTVLAAPGTGRNIAG